MDDYKRLMEGHPLWEKNRGRWEYLWESYVGGNVYKKGSYLTRYQYETPNEYDERILNTPLDNHCRGVIAVYNSFLFREEVEREFGSLTYDPGIEPFIQDADLEGRSFDAFMKDVSTYAAVFGHTWVMVSKPQTNAGTRADELQQGVRPYVSMISPANVIDWAFARTFSGHYELSYLKYIEDDSRGMLTVKEWTPAEIVTSVLHKGRREVESVEVLPNQLGKVPAVIVYSSRSEQRGIGVSIIDDIADLQRAIYNEYSEVEQLVRLANHPALVKTADVEAVAGAGAVIQMPDSLDPGLKPYLLQPSGANLAEVYNSIRVKIEAIDRIAHLGAIRATQTRTLSGIALESEFQQLNARLSEIADNLEVAEEQIWRLWALYQGKVWDGEIEYPDSFNIRDSQNELQQLQVAKNTATDPRVFEIIDQKILYILDEDPNMIKEPVDPNLIPEQPPFEIHIMVNPETGEEFYARTEQEHLDYAARGFVHKPDLDE